MSMFDRHDMSVGKTSLKIYVHRSFYAPLIPVIPTANLTVPSCSFPISTQRIPG